ncbi:hypothetical protein ACFSHP_12605 [Novosphingobium panipatense]
MITGDKVSLDYSPCACGNQGPSIRDTIVRYADLEETTRSGAQDGGRLCTRCRMNEITRPLADEDLVSAPFFLRGRCCMERTSFKNHAIWV